MEEGETIGQAARREAQEKICAEPDLDCLLAVYSLPHVSQVQLFFRARLVAPNIAPKHRFQR
jgi:ADP-ribose pyrophosphatase YjhB (NUDIX family)